MTVLILSTREQRDIADTYALGFHTQQDLAHSYRVSVSTIRSVLTSYGVIGKKPQITTKQATILTAAERFHLTGERIEEMVNAPSLTYPNVVHYVKSLDRDRLLTLFSQTSLGDWLNQIQEKIHASTSTNQT